MSEAALTKQSPEPSELRKKVDLYFKTNADKYPDEPLIKSEELLLVAVAENDRQCGALIEITKAVEECSQTLDFNFLCFVLSKIKEIADQALATLAKQPPRPEPSEEIEPIKNRLQVLADRCKTNSEAYIYRASIDIINRQCTVNKELLELAEKHNKLREIFCNNWLKAMEKSNAFKKETERLKAILYRHKICAACGKQLSPAEAESVHTCNLKEKPD